MAGIYNWCLSKAESMPRWQGHAIQIISLLGFAGVTAVAPIWAVVFYYVIVMGLVGVFTAAHRKVWKTRDDQTRSHISNALRTSKLIDRNKKK